MSNGEKDSTSLSVVSPKLLLTMKRRGRLPMLNLSAYAKLALMGRTTALISYSPPHCPYQKSLRSEAQKSDMRRAQILSSFSSEELAFLDGRGIRICLPPFHSDDADQSWAD